MYAIVLTIHDDCFRHSVIKHINFGFSFYTAVANIFNFSNQLSDFYKNWGMQGRETKIHKFYFLTFIEVFAIQVQKAQQIPQTEICLEAMSERN